VIFWYYLALFPKLFLVALVAAQKNWQYPRSQTIGKREDNSSSKKIRHFFGLFGQGLANSVVARWCIFKPKISTWGNVLGSCNGRGWNISCLLGLFYGHLVYLLIIRHISSRFGKYY
jgi:hypothetical protein